MQGALLEMFRKFPNWTTAFTNMAGDQTGNSDLSSEDIFALAMSRFTLHLESPRNAYDNYSNYMNQAIAIARLPWPQQQTSKPPTMPTDPVNQILLPIYARAGYKVMVNLALNRLLEGQLALRAYYLDHGQYPDKLADLAPTYLPTAPIDPFTDGQPLKYHRVGNRYLLYSVGPDCVDNGGTPIIYGGYDGKYQLNKYMLNEPSDKGDIVAGVNY